MARKESLTPLMKIYFDKWMARSASIENPLDEHYFNLFVRSCVRHRSGAWLLQLLRSHGISDETAVNIVSKFDTIKSYLHSATFYAGSASAEQYLWHPKGANRTKEDEN